MKSRVTNRECEYLSVRDDIWFGRERHDDYCHYHHTWCPDCRWCRFYEQDMEEKTDQQ